CAAVLIGATLAGLAVLFSDDRRIAMIFVVATVFAFAVLRLLAEILQLLARRAPSVRSTALRLALGNIRRPGSLTASVVLSLGLGLTLLVTLALIDGDLRRQITGVLPDRAPNFFFVDVQPDQIEPFSRLVSGLAPEGTLSKVPMLRGRVMAINGIPTEQLQVPPEGAWVLRGDRGLTYAETSPPKAAMTEGSWWPPGYSGEPL